MTAMSTSSVSRGGPGPGTGQALHSIVWRAGKVTTEEIPLERVSEEMAAPDSLVWFDLVDPDPGQILTVASELGLEPTAVEDAIAPFERAKATRHGDYSFLVAYATSLLEEVLPAESAEDPDGDGLVLHRVAAFIAPHGLITIRQGTGFDMEPVLERWHAARDLLHLGPYALVHGLLDVIVDSYFTTIQDLDDRIDDLEDQLFDDCGPRRGFQLEAYAMRKKLVALRRVVLPMRDLVNVLWRARPLELSPLDPWFSDLTDHVLRAGEWTDSLRDMIGTIFDTHLSLQDARLNTIMKKLAGWAAIIAVPTAVTGWFGQNLPYPGYNTPFGVALSALAILVGSTGLFLLFRRIDWL